MPGRPSARSTRTSAASGTRSARQSSHAVEIPDEGPVSSLRTKVAQVFADAQKTVIAQRKLVGALRKVHEACIPPPPAASSKRGKKARAELQGDFDEDDFNNEVCRCVTRILAIKRSESVGDRLIRFLCLYVKLADAEDRKRMAVDEPDQGAGDADTPASRLEGRILHTALDFLNARDKSVRCRAAQLIMNVVKHNPIIDEDIYHLIRIAMFKRVRDKEPSVRIQACMCLMLFLDEDDEDQDEGDDDSDDEIAGGIMEKLLDIMIHDPSAEVRRAVLGNIPLEPTNLNHLLERGREADPAARRIVYTKILPTLGDFRHMNLVTRDKILRWGLRDRDDGVRKAAGKLFREHWLENCVAGRDNRSEEEKEASIAPPNIEALSELLERIDVIQSGEEDGMAHEAMRGFWEGRPDYREAIVFDHDFWNNLDGEGAFIARTFNDYCRSAENSSAIDMIEDKMPEITMFAFILQKHLNKLMELAHEVASLDENEEHYDEVTEQFEEQDFQVQQLLHISMTLDYTDEVGRRQMYNIMRESIAQASLPEECTRLAIEVLRQMCGSRGESEFCALIVEAIADVRDSLVDNPDDGDAESMDDGEESFHSARSDIDRPVPAMKKKAKELSPEEEVERALKEIVVHSKCLHITMCTLQNVHGDIEPNASLMGLVNNLIIPAVQSHDIPIRERGVICMGLATLLSKKLAMENLDLFFHIFTKGHDNLKEIVVQILADVMITYPQLLAPLPTDPEATTEDAEPKPSPLVRPMTKVLLKGLKSDNKRIALITCMAASKLLLLGVLPPASTAEIMKAFTLTYFDPEAAVNPALRQALSYFLPVFCHSKLKNAQLMAHIVVPIMSKLLIMRDETLEEEADDMVAWPVITAHLSEWTDGRKVVGATELGLDGKISTSAEAEVPHVYLSIEILERALTNTCSKDERKPLLSLLSKLSIAPSSTTRKGEESNLESLSTLHALVAEAVEAKLGVDATQRNYLAKLEVSLTKRLGEVEQVTQIQDQDEDDADDTVVPPVSQEPEVTLADLSQADITELPDRTRRQGNANGAEIGDVDGSEIGDEDEDDTMLAGMQGEGTRMPLEDDTGDVTEEDESEFPPKKRSRPMVTEADIMESLLASEM
ncbi:nuclear condensing complex subunit [Ampelomyces quisqualis]|uniref:Nuclear condensing complex subunit n=1 Tax=Ampelomyces quisqualis TaxID=50730 RepID=A0A6A5QT26_AMPQU|nr:nuclear condensing complex subunit [Ampelomyces quisqualis]